MSEERAWFATAEVIEQAGISQRQAVYWTERGFLRPEGNGGSGRPWKWPAAELEIARRIGLLTDAGLPLEWAARFARTSWPSGELVPGVEVRVTGRG